MIINVDKIDVDLALQPRVAGLDLDHVRELETVTEAWPPLKVVRRGERYLLLDGFHRLAAAQNLGLETVLVEALDVPEDADLHAMAFALNAVHGRPLTLNDRRAFAAWLLGVHPEWSDREIGRRAGLVQPTIAKVREALEYDSVITPVETRIGRDGRTYPAKPLPAPDAMGLAPLLEILGRSFTPAERIAQRETVHYLQRLAETLEVQDRLAGFKTIDEAAEACRVVLGCEKASALAARLGWSSRNIVAIAEALGDKETL